MEQTGYELAVQLRNLIVGACFFVASVHVGMTFFHFMRMGARLVQTSA